MKKANKNTNLDLILFAIVVPLSIFLISSSWVAGLVSLLFISLFSYLIYKNNQGHEKMDGKREQTLAFLKAYFVLLDSGKSPKASYEACSSELVKLGISYKYDEIKTDTSKLDTLPLKMYKDAFYKSLQSKASTFKCEGVLSCLEKERTVYKKEGNENRSEILFSIITVCLSVLLLKVIFGGYLLDFTNIYLSVVLIVFTSIPIGMMYLYEYLRRN